MAVEARICRQLAAVVGHVSFRVDLREIGRPGGKKCVAIFAQLTTPPHRHVGQLLAFFLVHVKRHRGVTEFAPDRVMDALDVNLDLLRVAHLTGGVTAVPHRLGAVLQRARPPVPAALARSSRPASPRASR